MANNSTVQDISNRYISAEDQQTLRTALGEDGFRYIQSYLAGSTNAMEPYKQIFMKAIAANPDSPTLNAMLGDKAAEAITLYKNGVKVQQLTQDTNMRTRGENEIKDLAGKYLEGVHKSGVVQENPTQNTPADSKTFGDAVKNFVGDKAKALADAMALGAGGSLLEQYKQAIMASVKKAADKASHAAAPLQPLDSSLSDYAAIAKQRLAPEDAKMIETLLGSQGLKQVGQYMVGTDVEHATKDNVLRVRAENAIKDLAGKNVQLKRESALEAPQNGVKVGEASAPALPGSGKTDRAIG